MRRSVSLLLLLLLLPCFANASSFATRYSYSAGVLLRRPGSNCHRAVVYTACLMCYHSVTECHRALLSTQSSTSRKQAAVPGLCTTWPREHRDHFESTCNAHPHGIVSQVL